MLPILLAACSLVSGDAQPAPEPIQATTWEGLVQRREIVSKPYHIDGMYASMRGPSGFDHANLLETERPELLWITGYKTEVVDAGTQEPLSQEYMCHANLDFDAKKYYEHFPWAPPISGRLFTLSQGQQEIHFPPGMGIPVRSDMQLSLATQVLNLNLPDIDLTVKHKVEIEFVRDSDLNPYREQHPGWEVLPLFQTAVQGFKALENARYYGVPHDDADPHELGEGCGVGMSAIEGDVDEDSHGQKFTAHWVVPPGREVNKTNVTRFLNLKKDTRAHYIATHLHPMAESLTLHDLTTDEQVYQSTVRNSPERIGIDEVDVYSSNEGIPLKAGHEYMLTSVYDNQLDKDVDSMAVLYLYAHDVDFDRERALSRLATAELESSEEPATEPASM